MEASVGCDVACHAHLYAAFRAECFRNLREQQDSAVFPVLCEYIRVGLNSQNKHPWTYVI